MIDYLSGVAIGTGLSLLFGVDVVGAVGIALITGGLARTWQALGILR